MHPCLVKSAKSATPLHAVAAHDLKSFLAVRPAREAQWLKAAGFAAAAGEIALFPSDKSGIAAVVFGLGKGGDPLALASCAEKLPHGTYALASAPQAVARRPCRAGLAARHL